MNPSYNDLVFINCPFDNEYQPNLEAIVFAIYRCGFYPLSALNEDNALDNRLTKILNLIERCRYGVHDISRTELNAHNLPRFNMPFELGIFYGAKRFGDKLQKNKNALVFERTKFSYQNFISDLSGMDIKAHNNNIETILRSIRNWLQTSSRRSTIPGHTLLINDFNKFQKELPGILNSLSLEKENLTFNDLCLIVEEFLNKLL